jgi:hypothetical protein
MPKYYGYSQYWAMKEKEINVKIGALTKNLVNKAKREFERQRRYA